MHFIHLSTIYSAILVFSKLLEFEALTAGSSQLNNSKRLSQFSSSVIHLKQLRNEETESTSQVVDTTSGSCFANKRHCLDNDRLNSYIEKKFRNQFQVKWLWVSSFLLMVLVLTVVMPLLIYIYIHHKYSVCSHVAPRLQFLDAPIHHSSPPSKTISTTQAKEALQPDTTNKRVLPNDNASPSALSDVFGINSENQSITNELERPNLGRAVTMNQKTLG